MYSFSKVNLDEPIEFVATSNDNAFSKPVESMPVLRIQPSDGKALMHALAVAGQAHALLESLQSLCERADGVKLQTAMPTLDTAQKCLNAIGSSTPNEVLEWISQAGSHGADEVTIHFVEMPRNLWPKNTAPERPHRPECSAELLRHFEAAYGAKAPHEVRQALKGLKLQAQGATSLLMKHPQMGIKSEASVSKGQALMAKYHDAANTIVRFTLSTPNSKPIPELTDDDAFALLLGFD